MDWLLSVVSSVSTFLVATTLGAFSQSAPIYTTFPVVPVNDTVAPLYLSDITASTSPAVIAATVSPTPLSTIAPPATYVSDGVTWGQWTDYQRYTEARFVGMIRYTNLVHQQEADTARLNRLEKQIFSFMDETGEDLSDVRADDNGGTVDVSTLTDTTLILPIFSGAIGSNLVLGSHYLSGDGGDEGVAVDASGKVGIGTATPTALLTVAGDVSFAGALHDSTDSAGVAGMVLQTTGTTTRWVATSTLGLGGVGGGLFASDIDMSAKLAGIIGDETGSGAVVLATSPTLTTPNLGTPSALTLTNATGLSLTTGVVGVLPVANGGTGVTTLSAGSLLVGNGTGTITATTTAGLKATMALNNVENTALSTWAGSLNVTTVGTVTSGTWNGAAIGDAYLAKAGDWTGTFDGQDGTYYLSRTNHTGTQSASTISDFSTTTRSLLSSGVLGLNYATDTGSFSLTAGYTIPLSASSTDWDTAYSWGNHSTAGYASASTLSDYVPLAGGSLSGHVYLAGAGANLALGANWLSGDGDDEGVTVDASGNVGVGTSTPSAELDVWGDLRVGGSATPVFMTDTVSGQMVIGSTATTSLAPLVPAGVHFANRSAVFTNAAESLRYGHAYTDSLGYFILSASTVMKLGIAGSSAGEGMIDLRSNQITFNYLGANQDVTIKGDGDISLIYTDASTDRVGIGTSTPSQKLHVEGSARLTGALYDSLNSAGTSGYVLQTTATGTQWVATSSLWLGSGGATHDAVTLAGTPDYITLSGQQLTLTKLDLVDDLNAFSSANLSGNLSDETGTGLAVFNSAPTFTGVTTLAEASLSNATTTQLAVGSLTAGRIPYIAAGGRLIDDADLTFDGTSLTFGGDVSISRTSANWLELPAGDSLRVNGLLQLSTDVSLTRGATNRLDVSSGDTLNIVSGAIQIGASTVVDSSRRIFSSNGVLGAGTLAYSFSADTNTGLYGTGADVLHLVTAGVERFTIDSTGYVGIGTTTPRTLLSVAGSSTFTGHLNLVEDSANVILGSNYISGDGDDEGVFVAASGNVGVGTSTPGSTLTVAGTILATNLLGGATNVTVDANGNLIRDPSDRRLKTSITDIEGALDMVLSLRGVRYQWLDTDRFGTQTEVGFIAQEVDDVVPEVVSKGGEYWSLNTKNLVAVVVEAIQDIWEVVSGHGARLDTLEAENTDLKARLEALEAAVSTNTSAKEDITTGGNDVETDNNSSDESASNEAIDDAASNNPETSESGDSDGATTDHGTNEPTAVDSEVGTNEQAPL